MKKEDVITIIIILIIVAIIWFIAFKVNNYIAESDLNPWVKFWLLK